MIDTTEQGQSRNLAQTRDEGTVNLPPPVSDDTKKNEEQKTEEQKSGSKDKEISPELQKIIKRESTHYQWSKLSMNFGMLLVMVLTKLIRGPGAGKESIFGLEICSPVSWVAFLFLVLTAAVLTWLAAKIAQKEYKEKKAADYDFVAGD